MNKVGRVYSLDGVLVNPSVLLQAPILFSILVTRISMHEHIIVV